MSHPVEPKTEVLRALYWKEEILQVMFWIEGEGFGRDIDPEMLERFLGIDAGAAVQYLDRLVEEGLLSRSPEQRYALTDHGRSEGAKVFAEEFSDLTQPAHGECGTDCWCHQSVEEAEACVAERVDAGQH